MFETVALLCFINNQNSRVSVANLGSVFHSTIPAPGDKCSFSNCVPAYGIILEPALPHDVSVSQLAMLYPSYKHTLRTFTSVNPANSANVTVIMFENEHQCE